MRGDCNSDVVAGGCVVAVSVGCECMGGTSGSGEVCEMCMCLALCVWKVLGMSR